MQQMISRQQSLTAEKAANLKSATEARIAAEANDISAEAQQRDAASTNAEQAIARHRRAVDAVTKQKALVNTAQSHLDAIRTQLEQLKGEQVMQGDVRKQVLQQKLAHAAEEQASA